ncbi:MAG TPA: protoporphyrinogen oxidase [Terriglobales bacterium]|nr:protoporphyrinogen oxidase [Terriglobales bacterium]
MKRIAIIGGGISGLSAAYSLEKQKRNGAQLEYVLFEAGPRFGGVLHTERINDFVIEAGPDSFLTEKSWATDLCRELGLGDQLITSNDSERRTYIFVRGRLVPLPEGLTLMVPTDLAATFFSPLFSWSTKLRILREWFYRPAPNARESTVAEFVARHYGREMVERVADPLLAGVYGGSADELSVNAVLPRFAEIEARQGSLGRAMLASRKLQTTKRPIFTSLKNGMQSLAEALLAHIPETSRRANSHVESVKPESGKWLIVSGERTTEFDALVVAAPAHSAATLLNESIPQLASELEQINYSSSITVALAYNEAAGVSLPPGFGFLVPRSERKRVLACTFVHQKFVHRAPQGSALVRCFLGGSQDQEIATLSDQQIERILYRELQEILGVTNQPLFAKVYRWPKAMAQYTVGHKSRVERIRQITSALPGLALAGNAYNGIGIPDCLRSGAEAAAKISADLGIAPSPSR